MPPFTVNQEVAVSDRNSEHFGRRAVVRECREHAENDWYCHVEFVELAPPLLALDTLPATALAAG